MRSLPVIIVALLVGILGTILVLGFIGWIPIFGSRNNALSPGPGQIMVPVSVTSVPAYTTVGREHLFDVRNMRFMEVPVDPDKVAVEPISNVQDIMGRVLKHPKKAFMAFTEADFLPAGTRPGIAGAIPPGKRAIVVNAEQVSGVQGMLQGDRFDLLMSLPGRSRAQTISSVIPSGSAPPPAASTDTILVANNGQVSSGVTERKEEYFAASGLIGTPEQKMRTIREISFAVDPDEVVVLTKALASGRSLVAVVRSGRPESGANDVDIRIPQARNIILDEDPPPPAPAPAKMIEQIRGTNRTSTVVSPSR